MRRTVIALTLAWLMSAFVLAARAAPSPEQQILKLLNIEREHAGLPLLEWNEHLAEAAQAHSRQLASHRDLSHQFPGEPDLTARVSVTGARFNAVAENVALAGDPQSAHIALMDSPGHRANILNPKYNAVGVAIAWVNDDMYVTEDFARVVPAYSEDQFRQAFVTAFNRARRDKRFTPVQASFDPQLDHAACSGKLDPKSVLRIQPGASQAAVFTASQPDELPAPVENAAADSSLRRMSIGVCFRSDPDDRVSKFWVVAAFYTQQQNGLMH